MMLYSSTLLQAHVFGMDYDEFSERLSKNVYDWHNDFMSCKTHAKRERWMWLCFAQDAAPHFTGDLRKGRQRIEEAELQRLAISGHKERKEKERLFSRHWKKNPKSHAIYKQLQQRGMKVSGGYSRLTEEEMVKRCRKRNNPTQQGRPLWTRRHRDHTVKKGYSDCSLREECIPQTLAAHLLPTHCSWN